MRKKGTHMLQVFQGRYIDASLFKVDAAAVDNFVNDGRVDRALRSRNARVSETGQRTARRQQKLQPSDANTDN
jgi:transcription initiation factor TFIID subunit TAF12